MSTMTVVYTLITTVRAGFEAFDDTE
jgi:hypothetical protein